MGFIPKWWDFGGIFHFWRCSHCRISTFQTDFRGNFFLKFPTVGFWLSDGFWGEILFKISNCRILTFQTDFGGKFKTGWRIFRNSRISDYSRKNESTEINKNRFALDYFHNKNLISVTKGTPAFLKICNKEVQEWQAPMIEVPTMLSPNNALAILIVRHKNIEFTHRSNFLVHSQRCVSFIKFSLRPMDFPF